jgi:hypothetical protein
MRSSPIQPQADVPGLGGGTLRQAALVAGVSIGRAVTVADGTVTRVVRRTPAPLLAVAGLAGAAAIAALVHLFGGAPGSLGAALPQVHGLWPADKTPASGGVVDR